MLELDWDIVWTIVNLLILFLLLKHFLFKPITQMMESRTAEIENNLKDAEEQKQDVYKRQLSKRLTDVSGASEVFHMGVVTYANQAKEDLLSVSHETLEQYGAVSPQTAREMAEGIVRRSGSSLGVGITGIAGPDGGTAEKPVGLIYIAPVSYTHLFSTSSVK